MADWRLQTVRVLSFQGIGPHAEPVHLADLSPGINLIWAPNRRGKSCTARAITAAMRTDRDHAMGASVYLDYAVADDSPRRYEYNSQAAGLPDVPPGFANVAKRYQLSLHDLLMSKEAELAQALLEELYGGLNLDSIAAQLGFGSGVPRYTVPGQQYNQAYSRFRELSSEHQEVRRQSETLASLRSHLRHLRTQTSAAPQLQLVRDLLGARAALAQAAAKLVDYPEADADVLRRLGPNAAALLRGHLTNSDKLKTRINTLSIEISTHRETLDNSRFGDAQPLPTEAQLQRLENACVDLQEATTELKSANNGLKARQEEQRDCERQAQLAQEAAADARKARSAWPDQAALERARDAHLEAKTLAEKLADLDLQMAEAKAQRDNALARISPPLPPAVVTTWLKNNDPVPGVRDVGSAVRDEQVAAAALDQTQADYSKLQEQETALRPQGEAAASVVPILRSWLDGYQPAGSPPPRKSWLSYAALAVAMILAILLALLVHPGFWAAAVIVAVLAAVAFFGGGNDSANTAQAPPPRLPADVKIPSWTFAGVHEVLQEQQTTLNRWQKLRDELTVANTLRTERRTKYDQKQQTTRDAMTAFLGAFGIPDLAIDPTQVDALVANLKSLRQAADTYDACDRKRETCAKDLATELKELAVGLPHLSDNELPADPATAKECLARTSRLTTELAELERRANQAAEQANEAKHKTTGCQKVLEDQQKAHGQTLEAAGSAFADWLDPDAIAEATVAADFRALLTDLRQECATNAAAREQLRQAKQTTAELETELTEVEKKIDLWFADYGFPHHRSRRQDNLDRLRELEPQINDFQEFDKAVEHAQRDEQSVLAKLAHEQVPEALTQLSLEEISAKEAELEELSHEAEELAKKITRVEHDVERLCGVDELEQAAATLAEAREGVRTMRDRVIFAETGGAMLAKLKDRFLRDNSTTLDEAGRLLNDFSGHSYELSLSTAAGPALTATFVKHNQQTPQPLDQLSSNTRVQALMAARMAFLHTQERQWGGSKLPLIVDEALAIADPDGAESVMQVLMREAQQGRQILYFTAQPNEIRQWQTYLQALPKNQAPAWLIHDGMGDCRPMLPNDQAGWQPTELPPPQPKESLLAYATRLRTPQLAPWREDPVAAAHVFYLVDDDSKQLQQLAGCCRTIGELNAWLSRIQKDLAPLRQLFPESDCDLLVQRWRKRQSILRDAVELWRRGRAPQLTVDELIDANYLSRNQADKAASLLDEVNGDPRQFLDRLCEVDGIGGGTRDKFAERLQNDNRLPADQPMLPDAVYRELRRRHPRDHADVELTFARITWLWQDGEPSDG